MLQLYRPAVLPFSNSIYWKVPNDNSTTKPLSLFDFRDADSFELFRVDNGNWRIVDQVVKEDNYSAGRLITV